MKKIITILLLIVIITSGCSNKKAEEKPIQKEEKEPILEEPIKKEEPKYTDDNPIKLGFYLENNGTWNKVTEYYDPYQDYTDIDWFNVFPTEEQNLVNYGIKNTWSNYYQNYENTDNYRIGYEVKFTLDDDTEFYETITKPLDVFEYSFSAYLYIWVYDDINQTASWYSHLEPYEYNENTMMTSIKLMATDGTKRIKTPIYLTVFTFDSEDDFDPDTGHYRGISKTTLEIKPQ